jgi:hypothetical protein
MESSGPKRRFPPPWQVNPQDAGPFVITDAKGVPLAYVPCRDDLEGIGFAHNHLTSDEARRIANGIAWLPELMMQRKDFHQRGSGQYRWRSARPYHVALGDGYIRANWGFIEAVCKMNSIPFDGTGERIERDGLWCVYEFAVQLDAIQFWDRFDGRWLRGEEFIYPDRPKGCRSFASRLTCTNSGDDGREDKCAQSRFLLAESPLARRLTETARPTGRFMSFNACELSNIPRHR